MSPKELILLELGGTKDLGLQDLGFSVTIVVQKSHLDIKALATS